jgi:hypothetical protein
LYSAAIAAKHVVHGVQPVEVVAPFPEVFQLLCIGPRAASVDQAELKHVGCALATVGTPTAKQPQEVIADLAAASLEVWCIRTVQRIECVTLLAERTVSAGEKEQVRFVSGCAVDKLGISARLLVSPSDKEGAGVVEATPVAETSQPLQGLLALTAPFGALPCSLAW